MEKIVYDIMRPMPVFKPELREKNRAGLKGQTRRVIDPQPIATTGFWMGLHYANEDHFRKGAIEHCPYGRADDFCYMREPLIRIGPDAYYKDDENPVINPITNDLVRWRWKKNLLTSIFMPKEAARSIFRYTNIRVERVQDISRDDAKAEGVSGVWKNPPENEEHYQRVLLNPYVANYSVLWDEINADRGYGWDMNPWVWVLNYVEVLS